MKSSIVWMWLDSVTTAHNNILVQVLMAEDSRASASEPEQLNYAFSLASAQQWAVAEVHPNDTSYKPSA